jgi:hypothetical protein
MRAEHHAGALRRVGTGHEDRVLQFPGRVVGREVQGVEVVPLGLDLGAFGDLVAHVHEHVGQPLADRRHRVPGAGQGPVPGQRDVDRLGDQDPLVPVGFQFGLPLSERGLDGAARAADPLARLGPRGRGQGPDLRVGQRQRGPVAEVREPGLLEFIEVTRGSDGGQRLGLHALQFLRRQRGHLHGVIRLIWCGHRSLISCGQRQGSESRACARRRPRTSAASAGAASTGQHASTPNCPPASRTQASRRAW